MSRKDRLLPQRQDFIKMAPCNSFAWQSSPLYCHVSGWVTQTVPNFFGQIRKQKKEAALKNRLQDLSLRQESLSATQWELQVARNNLPAHKALNLFRKNTSPKKRREPRTINQTPLQHCCLLALLISCKEPR